MRTANHLLTLAEAGQRYRDWYSVGRFQIETVCAIKGWDADRFCDILSITSPKVAVRRNMRIAMHYMQYNECLPMLRAVRAALSHYEETGEIRGPKTGAFAAALKGDTDAVVLDVWMARALEVEQQQFSVRSVWTEAVKRVKQTAKRLDWSARQTQAAVWAGTLLAAGRNVPVVRLSEELTLFD